MGIILRSAYKTDIISEIIYGNAQRTQKLNPI